MGEADFSLALVVSAALLALWLDARLSSLRPHTPGDILVHAAISLFALFASVGLLNLIHGIPQGLFMVAVLTAFLPALVYSLVAMAWLLRALAALVRA